jgi:hypothetical protein
MPSFFISIGMLHSVYEWSDKRKELYNHIVNLNGYYGDAHKLLKNIDNLVRELNMLNVRFRNRIEPTILQKEKMSQINNAIDMLEKWLLVVTLTE